MSRFAFHPENLFGFSTIFGLKAQDCREARVLELGCKSGHELIAFASQYPNSEFIGIDPSDIAIEDAQKNIEALRLKNIRFHCMKLEDAAIEDLGLFDYIIVNNVFSLVEPSAQKALFTCCQKNLKEYGVAYVSHNTLPGWNMAKSIREIVRFHTENYYIPAEKSHQARLLLSFLKDNIPDKNSPYGILLNQEINLLQDNDYLFSHYLSDCNQPYYFHEFMSEASQHQLQYLCDTAIETMFVGNFSENIRNQFNSISNDLIKTEQYLDFLTNRRFRSSLLCHANVTLNRNLTPQRLQSFYFRGLLQSAVPFSQIDIHANHSYEFKSLNGIHFSSANALELALIKILIENKHPLSEEQITKKMSALFSEQAPNILKETVLTIVLRLFLGGAIALYMDDKTYCQNASETPLVSNLTRLQAKNGYKITSQLGDNVVVDDFARLFIQQLDGNHDKKALVKKMMAHFERQDLKLSINGVENQNQEHIKQYVSQTTETLLQNMAENALLIG